MKGGPHIPGSCMPLRADRRGSDVLSRSIPEITRERSCLNTYEILASKRICKSGITVTNTISWPTNSIFGKIPIESHWSHI